MLVLARRIEEGLTITTPEGRVIHVTVLDMNRSRVRLGVEADPAVRIDRDEIAERIQAEKAGPARGPR